MTDLTRMMTLDPEQEMGAKGSARGKPTATKKSEETARKNSQENYQQQLGKGVQDGKRQNLGGGVPGEILQNPEMDGTFMFPCYHTKGECWDEGCKYSKMHFPVSEVPQKEKKEYLDYMRCCRKKSSTSE
jgi:hypothetical protein